MDVNGDDVAVRPYDPGRANATGERDRDRQHRGDAPALWRLKRRFELELGRGSPDDDKAERYAAKLTDDYRDRYLAWVDRCVDQEPGCVRVAAVDRAGDGTGPADGVVGYAFVLPASLSLVWDAAVLNELYVRPGHRGTGVADDLLTAAVAHAREQDLPLDRLVLDVDRSNDRARAFYDRHGFEHWGEMVAREL
jgi:ribosomal protein S18 acetylase RimI-like enzyme